MKVVLYTTFALAAFALNSVLCRVALRGEEIDPASFTGVRLVSGAVALIVISFFVSKNKANIKGGSWLSAFFLFAYAICFSLAYLDLTAGTGALILFGSVQLTMIAASIANGERPHLLEWLGLATAAGGLVYLVLPGLASPPFVSSLLMAAAGAAWGFYTLRGKGSGDPLANTTGNFVRSVPFIVIAAAIMFAGITVTSRGMMLAAISGAITSGLGYTIWYAALKHLTATRAAVLQLSVPVIAAVLGIVLLAEIATVRLGVAAALILGGIGITLIGKK